MGRVALLLGTLVLMVAILGGAVYWALPYLGSKTPSSSRKVREFVVGLDLSKSNPLITDKQFAKKVSERVGTLIEDLRLRDEVKIRTFGSLDPREQPLRIDQVVTMDSVPENIVQTVEGVVAGVPTLIEQRRIVAQDSTNIIGFLENMAAVVNCKKHQVTIILASDGIEDSEEANLSRSEGALRPPPSKLFAGCRSLQILGLGVGLSNPAAIAHLREQWEAWSKAAGFKEFEGLNDW